MRYASITKTFRFEALDHRGQCSRLHGHSYRLEVTLRGPIKDAPGESDHGIVMDFYDLSSIVKNVIVGRLDHQDLNVVTGLYTTTENLVYWMWDELVAYGVPGALLHRIRL